MSFFWPTHLNAEPGFAARLGRFIHWMAIAIAALFAFVLANITVGDPSAFPGFLFIALAIALIGRGLRFVFALE